MELAKSKKDLQIVVLRVFHTSRKYHHNLFEWTAETAKLENSTKA